MSGRSLAEKAIQLEFQINVQDSRAAYILETQLKKPSFQQQTKGLIAESLSIDPSLITMETKSPEIQEYITISVVPPDVAEKSKKAASYMYAVVGGSIILFVALLGVLVYVFHFKASHDTTVQDIRNLQMELEGQFVDVELSNQSNPTAKI